MHCTFGAHYMNMELAADSVNSQIWLASDTSAAGCNSFNAQGVCTSTTSTQAWYDANGLGANAYWETRPRDATMETEVWDLDVTFEGDGFTLEAEVGGSEATGGTEIETNAAFITGTGSTIGSIDFTGDQVKYAIDNPGVTQEALPTAGNYEGWEGLQGNAVKEPRSDEEVYAQVDVEFETDFGVISSIKTGFRWSDHDVSQSKTRPDNSKLDGAANANMYNGTDYATGDTIDVGFGGFKMAEPNAKFVLDLAQAQAGNWFEDRSASIDLNEESIAAYVMANFEGEGFRGNFGFRYIETDASSSAYFLDDANRGEVINQNNGFSTTKVTEKSSYSEILPSANIAIDLADDVILRFSAAQVISRPNYNDMFSNYSLAGYGDLSDSNNSVVKGTPELSPFKAFQSDLGVEWYYSDSSMVSAAYFVKEVNTFTTFSSAPGTSIGIVDPGTNTDSWDFQSYEDGDGGSIDGVELQWQHAFDSGFGTVVNYTYANTDANADNFVDRNAVFSDSSDHTVNLVGYYENELFSARAAYSWRSEYMIRETGFYGAREHQEFGTLDLSAAWFVTDNITVTFDAVNVLEEDSVQLGADKSNPQVQSPRFSQGFPVASYEGEARYSVGAQFRF
jgi:iron complex outermembrane receptor protein